MMIFTGTRVLVIFPFLSFSLFLTKLLKAHVATLKDIAKVDKYIRIGEADDDYVDDTVDDIDSERISDTSLDDLFTDPAASRPLKKRFSGLTRPHSTLALATVGVVQQRLPNKRKLNPTQFYCRSRFSYHCIE